MAGSVSVVLVRPIVAALPSAQHAAFWAATDLTPELIGDDDARISPAKFCVAWAELVRTTGKPSIALDIASALPAGAFGIVEYVCRSAPTLGEALRQWVRYLNLLDDAVSVGLEIDADRAYLQVQRESEAPAPASHELCFALVALRMRELATAPFRVSAVEFVHAGDAATYRAWFEAPVTFGAPITQLVMPRSALAIALTSADPKLLKILTRAADELHAHPPEDPTLTAQVSRVLHDALRADEGHADHVAKRLGLTTRSLQRRLKDENTSFNAVREQVRRELSRKYLADGLSIAEISFLLGFSEPSAFFRAFKRWTGQTPVEARRRATASGS
jgi:AraC-like DNA-binding protein